MNDRIAQAIKDMRVEATTNGLTDALLVRTEYLERLLDKIVLEEIKERLDKLESKVFTTFVDDVIAITKIVSDNIHITKTNEGYRLYGTCSTTKNKYCVLVKGEAILTEDLGN